MSEGAPHSSASARSYEIGAEIWVPDTKRHLERERYYGVNIPYYGWSGASARWGSYEELILDKYGGPTMDDSWRMRDRHRRSIRVTEKPPSELLF